MKMFFAVLAGLCSGEVVKTCTSSGKIAMCFDGNPTDKVDRLLKILDENDTKATFHISIEHLANDEVEKRVKEIFKRGHLIGMLLTMDYSSLNSPSVKTIEEDLKNKIKAFQEIIGRPPRYIRYTLAPNPMLTQAAGNIGLILTTHNLDSQSYKNATSNSVLNVFEKTFRVSHYQKNSFISLQALESTPSIDATKNIIDKIKEYNYVTVRLDVCCGHSEEYSPKPSSSSSSGPKGTSLDDEEKKEDSGVRAARALALLILLLLF
ncbi:MAG: Chitin/polysaccharide deacetylase [Amphiamblys sp. WSBS2006]|nr:MAG: Chitin/polysaccharide deacetylase [Amphiamblys sp. WSBS2006]